MSRRNTRFAPEAQPRPPLGEFTARKLRSLLPLLASDIDGEVLATVAAIRRTLKAADLDLHALARLLTDPEFATESACTPESPCSGAPEPQPPPKPPEPDPWRETVLDLLKMHGECALCLSSWDRTFLSSLSTYYTKRPSVAQLDILDKIAEKAGRLHHAA